MRHRMLAILAALVPLALPACGGGGRIPEPLVVNSLADLADPPEGTVTLRSALAAAPSGARIEFDAALDGGVIELTLVDSAHTILKGEVMGIRMEPSGPVSYLEGYFERDYGKSALYARKNVVIDASALPQGITLAWTGAADARVLAVYGNLELKNVTITGGRSVAEDIATGDPDDQPWTLARGGAVAVWGEAVLQDCVLHDNRCEGDFDSSRDRGAFGGGIYADILFMEDCVVAGNTVVGGGAAGGGVYSVGGAGTGGHLSQLDRCAVTGNGIAGLFAYGAGVYSDGGGIGNANTLELVNCTVARNAAGPAPGLPPFLLAMGYWRGGGAYMSNGYLRMHGCTVVENEVSGYARTDDLGKRNLAGGIAATIGNAHAVEDMRLGQCIVAGNVVHELGMDGLPANTYAHDIFTGSLLYFRSGGYNRFGVVDFSQILVPVGEPGWWTLSRRHYPKQDDEDGVALADVVDLAGGVTYSATLLSAGVDAGNPAVLHYAPRGTALGRVPNGAYLVPETFAQYAVVAGGEDNFLEILLDRVESHYGLPGFAADCVSRFEEFLVTVDADDDEPGIQPYVDPGGAPILTLADTAWFGPAETWPKELANYAYIEFFHHLDADLADAAVPGMGPELLGDAAWLALFDSGALTENPDIEVALNTLNRGHGGLLPVDQRGVARPATAPGDIGAIEAP